MFDRECGLKDIVFELDLFGAFEGPFDDGRFGDADFGLTRVRERCAAHFILLVHKERAIVVPPDRNGNAPLLLAIEAQELGFLVGQGSAFFIRHILT